MGKFNAILNRRIQFVSIVITGSLAYDHIMHFPGYFSDHIIPEKIKMLNISFLVDSMKKMRGGCASNIAYSLSLLGERSSIMATVGEDFQEYSNWLEKNGIDTSLIKVIPGEYTACCFATTDLNNNQIIKFFSGAMGKAHTLSFGEIDYKNINIAIISPNDPVGMVKYYRECQELSIPYIFDPGHQIPRLTPREIIGGIESSLYLVLNGYELEMILSRTGLNEEEIIRMTKALFITKGAEGSYIKTKDETIQIPAARPREVMDPTGAGDAYRAGLIKGHLKSLPLPAIGKLASLIGAFCVEKYGPAEHTFTMEEVAQRYYENFGEGLIL